MKTKENQNNMIFLKGICIVLAALLAIFSLTGCEEDELDKEFNIAVKYAEKDLDNITDEEMEHLINPDQSSIDETLKVKSEAQEDISLALDNLPQDILNMVPLCEAINKTQVDIGKLYTSGNSLLVWNSLYAAVQEADFVKDGMTMYSDSIGVPISMVYDYAYAMFGSLEVLPELPSEFVEDGRIEYDLTVADNEPEYRFSMEQDSGEYYRVIRVTKKPDATVELELASFDENNNKEIVDFVYLLEPNSRDTGTSARYSYQIIRSSCGDTFTYDIMNGRPYISMAVQEYGNMIYKPSDPRYSMVKEIPYFESYVDTLAVYGINERIEKELVAVANDSKYQYESARSDSRWVEIKSYPVSNDDYIQVVSLIKECPDYNSAGSIRSYNYDIVSKHAISTTAALLQKSFSEQKLAELITEAWDKNKTGVLNAIEYQGFLMKQDNSIDYYVKLHVGTENSSSYDRIGRYNSDSGEFKVYMTGEDIIPSKYIDEFTPPLTHGR